MFCTFATLSACFSLSGIYIDASAINSSNNLTRYYDAVESAELISSMTVNGPLLPTNSISVKYKRVSEEYSRNPIARGTIGYSVEFTRSFSFHIDYAYEKSAQDSSSANRYSAGFTWRPFSRE